LLEKLALPIELMAHPSRVLLRGASSEDLAALVRLLADDPINASRGDIADDSDLPAYANALARIIDDSANDLIVAVEHDRIVATLQLTLIPGMARRGATRLLVEAVWVAADRRSAGIGGAMMRWVVDIAAPALGADLVQLTSDAARADAHRFYERLGFVGSHIGFKLKVQPEL
jgi:GNAT superfamily N-acetyltransferase